MTRDTVGMSNSPGGRLRIVVKIGSSSLTDADGRVDTDQIQAIADEIAGVREYGIDVLLVSSGAIACALDPLGFSERPTSIADLQAAASVGQGLLMHRWTEAFSVHGISVGQVLLTSTDMAHRESYVNARNTLWRLLELGVVPIVNENDATAVQEIRMGDNDTLAAMVATTVRSDLLVLLSDVVGLCDPATGECLRVIERIDDRVTEMAGGSSGPYGSGGMATKIGAARIVTASGIGMVIAHSRKDDTLRAVAEALSADSGDTPSFPGTYFVPGSERVNERRSWIAFGRLPSGSLVVDSGAQSALLSGGGSLLAAGVLKVEGSFAVGDTVDVVGPAGVPIARGMVNYSAEEVDRIKGLRSSEAVERFGDEFAEEVVHRDSMVVLSTSHGGG